MYRNKKILAMIPARGGSKEIPGKNIRLVAGKPLIAWTIEAAAASRYVDRVIVSTDDRLIAETAEGCGAEVPFLRPAELASDDAPIEAPALHAIENLPGYDYLATLQPTTPLRGAETLDACIAYALDRNASACASMTEPAHKPYWMYRIREDRTIEPLMKDKYPSRQLFPKYHTLNGAIYLAQTDASGSGLGSILFLVVMVAVRVVWSHFTSFGSVWRAAAMTRKGRQS